MKILKNNFFWLFVFIFLATVSVSYLALLRHYSFNSTIFDLGIFENTIWNTSNSRFFKCSINSITGNHLGVHSSLFLILIVPFYKIFPHTETLIISQSLFLMLAAWPIYLIARDFLKSEKLALAISLIYLLFPAVHHIALSDFHEIAFAPFFALFTFYFLEKRKNLKYFIFLITLFLIKEELALLGVVFSIYLLIKRRYKLSIKTFLLSVFWFILSIYYLIPFFSNSDYAHISNKYGQVGNSLGDIIVVFFTNPQFVIDTIFTRAKALFVWKVFMPLAFLPFLGWKIFLPFLPLFVLYHLLATHKGLYSLTSHYMAFSIPVIFIAMVLGLVEIQKKYKKLIWHIIILTFILSIYSFISWSPYPFSKYYHPEINYKKLGRPEIIKDVKNLIPEKAYLSVENNIGPHFIKRENIYMFPRIEDSEYIIIDNANFRFNSKSKRDDGYMKLKNDKTFELIFSEETIEVYKKINS